MSRLKVNSIVETHLPGMQEALGSTLRTEKQFTVVMANGMAFPVRVNCELWPQQEPSQ